MSAMLAEILVQNGQHRYPQQQWTVLIMNGLRAKHFDNKVKMSEISARTGLSVSTINKMMYGETKLPRYNTVMVLLKYLGYRLFAEI